MKRIARSEHADLLPARGENLVDAVPNGLGQRRALPLINGATSRKCRSPPNTMSAVGDQRARRMRSGPRRRPRRCRRWTASASVRQCSRHERLSPHHAHPHPWRHGGSAATGGALAGRADLAVTLSLAGRTAQPLPQPVPLRVGGFGGAARPCRLSARRAHRCPDRRDASIRRRDLRQCGAEAARVAGVPLLALQAGRHGVRSLAIIGSRSRPCEQAVVRSAQRRAASFSRSGARSSRRSPRRRSIFIWCAASIPSIRRLPCPRRSTSTARGPFARG